MGVNILCVGDVVGKPGRRLLADHLPDLIRQRAIDLVVCNAENAVGGSGLTGQVFSKLLHYGVDAVTLGDHVYRRKEIAESLAGSDRLVRPANISPKAVGRRWTIVPTKDGQHQVAVACVLGNLYMGTAADLPWASVDALLEEIPASVRIRVIDFHAQASSEKVAMGWHLDGRVSVVFGTHTHVPTADARVLPGGTAYVSDLGMTGPYDGVLGRRKDRVLYALTTSMPAPFDVAKDDPRLCAAMVEVDPDSGLARSIERVEVAGLKAQPAGQEQDETDQ